MSNMNFGFNDVEDKQTHTGGRVIPDSGDYDVMISDIEMKSNNKGNGHNIEVTYSILSGDFAGSELKEWLSVINKNETAQNIAQSKLKAIYIVTGNTSAGSFTELQGGVLRVRVHKKPHTFTNNDGEKVNTYNTEIVMYLDSEGKNANDKEIPAYTGPAIVGETNTSGQARRPNVVSTSSSSNVSRQESVPDYDDEIPF